MSKPTRRVAILLALALLAVTALSACGGGGGTSSSGGGSTAEGGGKPTRGGNLTFAVSSYPQALDASLNGGRGDYAAYQIVDELTSANPETGEVEPYLAKSWKVSDGSKKFVFQLRSGVTFSDGTKFGAQSVVENLEALVKLDEEGVSDTLVQNALATFTGAKATGPLTVEVNFSAPALSFLLDASDPYMGFYSKSTLAESSQEQAEGKVVATGPFTYGKIQQNQSIELVARKGYDWAPAGASNQGQAYLDSVTFKVVPQSGVRSGLLSSGQADAIGGVEPTDEQTVTATGGSLVAKALPGLVAGFRPNPYSTYGGTTVYRQALTKAIDREEILDTLLSPETSELVSSAVARTTPLWSDQSAGLAYDPKGAEKLLEGEGWKVGSGGIREKDGKKLAIKLIYADVPLTATLAELELIQSQVKKVGIELELIPQNVAQYTSDILEMKKDGSANETWDFLSGSGPSNDPGFLAGLFSDTNPALGGFDDPVLQAGVEKLAGATSEASRKTAAAELQSLLVEDGYWVPVKELNEVVGVSSKVKGFYLDDNAAPVFYDTYLEG